MLPIEIVIRSIFPNLVVLKRTIIAIAAVRLAQEQTQRSVTKQRRYFPHTAAPYYLTYGGCNRWSIPGLLICGLVHGASRDVGLERRTVTYVALQRERFSQFSRLSHRLSIDFCSLPGNTIPVVDAGNPLPCPAPVYVTQ